MAELSEKAKEQINSMSKEDLLYEINKGVEVASIFNKEQLAYAKARYAILLNQDDDQHKQETLNVAKHSNEISQKALETSEQSNKIAEQALSISSQSKRFSQWAIAISLVALIVQIFLSK